MLALEGVYPLGDVDLRRMSGDILGSIGTRAIPVDVVMQDALALAQPSCPVPTPAPAASQVSRKRRAGDEMVSPPVTTDPSPSERIASQRKKVATHSSAAPAEVHLILWSSLPGSVWVKVFSFISYYDRMLLPFVCKSWRHLSSEWRSRELQLLPSRPWQSTNMTRALRALIVDWLMEISNDYDLATHTLFLGVNYMDRFLSVKCVEREDLQTAAVTCLWIASKYEEQLPPTLSDFVHTGFGAYTASTLMKFEGLVLHHLGFALAVPTILHFLIEYLGQLRIENKTCNQLARFFAELALNDYRLSIECCASVVAAASVYLALNVFKQVEADRHAERLAAFSAYHPTDVELLACCKRFSELIPLLKKGPYTYRTLKLKYDSPEGCDALRLVLSAQIRY